MPGTDGITAAAASCMSNARCCKVLILTVLGKPGNLRRALAAHVARLSAERHPSGENLVDAVRKVAAGPAGDRPAAGA